MDFILLGALFLAALAWVVYDLSGMFNSWQHCLSTPLAPFTTPLADTSFLVGDKSVIILLSSFRATRVPPLVRFFRLLSQVATRLLQCAISEGSDNRLDGELHSLLCLLLLYWDSSLNVWRLTDLLVKVKKTQSRSANN